MRKEKALEKLRKAKREAMANSTVIKVGRLELNEAIDALESQINLKNALKDAIQNRVIVIEKGNEKLFEIIDSLDNGSYKSEKPICKNVDELQGDTMMKNVRNWFENDATTNENSYYISEYEWHLEVRTETALFMIVAPHSGTNNRWMLRVAAIASFDRWGNSTAVEEFFDTDIDLCDYLQNNQLSIYKELLSSLSEDYEEIDNF